MERTLASPVRRGALTLSSLLHQGFVTLVQTLILLGVAVLAGARFGGGASRVAVLVACSVMLGAAFAALSDAIAVLVRQQEALIAVSQFLTLPLTFLPSVMLAPALMPSWVATVARVQPGRLGCRRGSSGAGLIGVLVRRRATRHAAARPRGRGGLPRAVDLDAAAQGRVKPGCAVV